MNQLTYTKLVVARCALPLLLVGCAVLKKADDDKASPPAIVINSKTSPPMMTCSYPDTKGSAWDAFATVGNSCANQPSKEGAPSPRAAHSALWTGTKMLIWGGEAEINGETLADGGIYDPVTDSWQALPTAGSPSGRTSAFAAMVAGKAVVWGGNRVIKEDPVRPTFLLKELADGAFFEMTTQEWTSLPPLPDDATKAEKFYDFGVLADRFVVFRTLNAETTPYSIAPGEQVWTAHTKAPAWTVIRKFLPTSGSVGFFWDERHSRGFVYDLSTDKWTAVQQQGAPPWLSAIQITSIADKQFMVYGQIWDQAKNERTDTVAYTYDAATNTWSALSTEGAADSYIASGGRPTFCGGVAIFFSLGDDTTIGRAYEKTRNQWRDLRGASDLNKQESFSSVCAGSELIFWGGYGFDETTRTSKTKNNGYFLALPTL